MNPRYLLHRIFTLLSLLTLLLSQFTTSHATAQAIDVPGSNTDASERVQASKPNSAPRQPALLVHPISISRLQSAYTPGAVTISLAVTNNLPATHLPEVAGTATVTDTMNILASFVITADVNTLRGVTVIDTLANGATLLAASGNPAQNGSSLAWSLPDLPPQATAAITLSVQTPASGADFIDIDSGAQANASLWGNPVTTAAIAAVLIPAGIDPAYTQPTIDADSLDGDMLWKSAEFVQDPLALFAYVQSLANDPYAGSVRGTRGALWGEAGNSVDKSSLLIAMLRAAGVPARYRHGTLSISNTQTILGSMFPAAAGLAGYIPPGTPVADPLNDSVLLAAVSDHWWVEAYLPSSGWTDLDPSFPEAQPGDVFTTPGANDRIAELPDTLRQHIQFELEVEQYSQFPIGGINLVTSTPLVATFSAPKLASKAITFGHLVSTQAAGGLFSVVTHTYTPFFGIAGENYLTTGDEFQDILSTFPLSSRFTTAEWLNITVLNPDGSTALSLKRELKDLIGLDVRQNGGNPVIALPADNRPFTSFNDAFASWFLPNRVKNLQYALKLQTENARALLATARATEQLPNDLTTPEGRAALRQATLSYFSARNDEYSLAGLEFAKLADPTAQDLENSLRVKFYYDQPRIIITNSREEADGSVTQSMDLRSTQAEALVYPGQAQLAKISAEWMKAVAESYFEGHASYRLTGQPPLTVSRIFDEMGSQGIRPAWITPGNSNQLGLYLPDPSAYAYAQKALLEGRSILIPQSPVMVDGNPVLGWWEVDPQTGQTTSVLQNGLHGELIEYDMLLNIWDFSLAFNTAVGMQSSVANLWGCIAASVIPALQGHPGSGASCVDGWSPPDPNPPWIPPIKWFNCPPWQCGPMEPDRPAAGPASWRYLPAYLCPVDNCGLEEFALGYSDMQAIPLPDITFGYNDRFAGQNWASRVITVTDNGGGGPPDFSLSTDPTSGNTLPGAGYVFDINASANFDGALDAWIYLPEGWEAQFDPATLQTQVMAKPGVPPGDYTLNIVAQSEDHPELVKVVQHVVTVPDDGSLYLGWEKEPNLTIPFDNPASNASSDETNDNEAEIPDSAFRVGVINFSGQSKTLTLSVSGAPDGWVILGGSRQTQTEVTLAPNARAQFGLYVSPLTLPTPGTSFTLDLQLTDGLGGIATGTIPWVMPGQPFNYLTLQPSTLYLGSNSSTAFSFSLLNNGNANGDFPVSAVLPPLAVTVSGLPGPVSLAVGETQTFSAQLNTAGVTPGARFPLVLASPAPYSYTQYAVAQVQVVTPLSEPVFQAADDAANQCAIGGAGFSQALQSLALAMTHLEATCQSGGCALPLRDQTVQAANSVVLYGQSISSYLTQVDQLAATAAAMSGHTSNTDLLNDLQALSNTVSALDDQLCRISQHQPQLKWTPYYGAAAAGQPVTYTLELTNLGSEPTTYALTVTLPSGVQTFSSALDPGASSQHPFVLNLSVLGLYDLDASASVSGESAILAHVPARLNVVDRFVQLTAVQPEPDFVETGVSSTTISIEVANIANIPQTADAQLVIQSPAGATSFSADMPLNILAGSPRSYPLQKVDTSGWSAGVYTVTVMLLDNQGHLIPDGSGYGYLGVGQGLGISHAVQPLVAAPGTFTVTTLITAELLTPPILPNTPAGAPILPTDIQLPDNTAAVTQLPAASPQLPDTTLPITRTEDTNPAIVYAGVWTTVNNINSVRASHGDYTWADANGETATFTFNGTWVHIGFVSFWQAGQAEIRIDGISQGTVDTYTRDSSVKDVAYSNLSDTPHTLQIVVLGTHHPNSTGNQILLDYIDTWDGTNFPDGLVEQASPRVWRSADWTDVADPDASGGSYMTDSGANGGYAWFPFTGDSVTFVAFANGNGFRAQVSVDGVWKDNLWMYSSTDITKTISFDGLGPGPHVMLINHYYGKPNVDAFVSPAIEPGYVPPVYTGIVRYEEDNPAILYNGYPYSQRNQSFTREDATNPQTSDFGAVRSNTVNDTIQLSFFGRWVNLGITAETGGGKAEVFIDGVSQGEIGTYGNGSPVEFQYGDLITGTHTLSITVLGQPDPPGTGTTIHFDYIDVWDGTPMSDDFTNIHKADVSSRLHYNKSGVDATHPNAIGGDFFSSGLSNSNTNLWYSFTGTSFVLYGLTLNNTTNVNVYVDGQFIRNVSFSYPYSEQPYAVFFKGYTDGPHDVLIRNGLSMRLDGFRSNPTSDASYQPLVEWYESNRTAGASIWGGLHVPVAVGDINGDGLPELVVASSNVDSNGELFVLKGDGSDAGDGTPIIWSHPYHIFNGFENVGAPAIGELDGQPGAEIVHPSAAGLYVFHADGSIYWYTDTLHSFAFFSSPAIGNVDADPEPEIVVNMDHILAVFEHDGVLAWQHTFPNVLGMPVLADLNGDGILDILIHDASTLYAYNYNFGSPVLMWSQTLSTPLSIYGSPAVADIDGQLPGGDPGPEVAIASAGFLNVFNGEDGSPVWSTPLVSGNASGVSVGDVDGDGEIELVTGEDNNSGLLYAVNADGSILWSVPALDNSPLNVSLMDLNGDGIDEIAFNGADQGLTIYNGPDGAILFNEPSLGVISQTGSDYPLFADVDNDGYGELVVASQGGIRVFGWDGVWGQARPVWNQLTYHITNVNDDLSIPPNEANSWEVHNTYRAQSWLVYPMPAYAVTLTHTAGLEGVTVLSNTFNIPPDFYAGPSFGWNFQVDSGTRVVTHTFESRLDGLIPGETRLVAQGTSAAYRLAGGHSILALPPLYVSVPHLIDIDPPERTASPGVTVLYTVTLSNPGDSAALYSLNLAGLPDGWNDLPASVNVPAHGQAVMPFSITIPSDAAIQAYPFNVQATYNGGADQGGASLEVQAPRVTVQIEPQQQTVPTGSSTAYNLTITNLEDTARTYNLSAEGLAAVTLPTQISVPGGASQAISMTVQALSDGPNPFNVIAATGDSAGMDTASIIGEGFASVAVTLSPEAATSGPGVLTVFEVTVTNLGSIEQSYDLSAAIPFGWQAELTLFGQPVSVVSLLPGSSIHVQLMLTPPADAPVGNYPFSITALSQASDPPAAQASAAGSVQVTGLGVVVEFISGPGELLPNQTGTWLVQVTNTGSQSDTYDLSSFGPLAAFSSFTPAVVTLNPGQSQTVSLVVGPLQFALPQDYLLGAAIRSRANPTIRNEDTTQVIIGEQAAVAAAWLPETQAVSGTLEASFSLVITNTGNTGAVYQIALSASPNAAVQVSLTPITLPAHQSAILLVTVQASGDGIYHLTAFINGVSAQTEASAILRIGTRINVWLPLVVKIGP